MLNVMSGPSMSRIPARVDAAMCFLHFARQIVCPTTPLGERLFESGELSKREHATYDAALDVLNLYFRGEQDFGDVPPQPVDNEPENPQPPVPVMG